MLKKLIDSIKQAAKVKEPKKLVILDYVAIACFIASIGAIFYGNNSASFSFAALSLAALEYTGNAAAIDAALLLFVVGVATSVTSMTKNARLYVGEIAKGYRAPRNEYQYKTKEGRAVEIDSLSQSRGHQVEKDSSGVKPKSALALKSNDKQKTR